MGPLGVFAVFFVFVVCFFFFFFFFFEPVLGSIWGRFWEPRSSKTLPKTASEKELKQKTKKKTRNRATSQRFLLLLRARWTPKRSQNGPEFVPKGVQKRDPKNDAVF